MLFKTPVRSSNILRFDEVALSLFISLYNVLFPSDDVRK